MVSSRPLKGSWTVQRRKPPKGFTATPVTGTFSSSTAGVTAVFGGSVTSPTSGSLNVTFTLNTNSTGVKPFCIGHTFKKGEVPTGVGIVFSNATGQVTAKNYWDDGSLKYALLAGTYTQSVANTAVTVTLTDGTSSTGTALTTADLKATGITASVNAGTFGSASWSTTDWDNYFGTPWVSGHLMSSWLYRKQIGSDAHLVAWLEVRLWYTGAVEVLPWIENGYLNVAGPTNKQETFTFTLGGSAKFGPTLINLPHHCRTPLVSGTVVSYWLGSTAYDITFKHDTDYMQSTNTVPAYDSVISTSSSYVTGLVSSFTPLQAGNVTSTMGGGGYDPSIAILPYWDALYFTTTADVTKAIQWNAYSYGRYATHYRDETTNQQLLFTSYPNLNLPYYLADALMGMNHMGSSTTGTYTPEPSGTNPVGFWVDTHHPSPGYLPYLLTGRYYFLDELQFTATVTYLRNGNSYRQGSKGIHDSYYEQQRGAAFNLRTLFQAAAATPDSDTSLRNELINSIEENIDFYYGRYITQPSNPFGAISPYVGADANADEPADNLHFTRVFMNDYSIACWGHGIDIIRDHVDAARQTKLDSFYDWHAGFVVGRLGGSASDEFLYRNAVPYNVAIASADSVNWLTGVGSWYANWGQVYSATFSGTHVSTGTDYPVSTPYAPDCPRVEGGNLVGGYFGNTATSAAPGGYWGYMQPAIAYAVKHGVTGAVEGWRRLTNAPNWYVHQQAMNTSPELGVAPRPLPKWRHNLDVNEWTTISGSSLSYVPPSSYQQIGGSTEHNRIDNWNGFAIDTRDNKIWNLGCGGHGDYFGNEVTYLPLNDDAPVWVEQLPPTPYTTSLYSGGYPASPRHLEDSTRLSGQHAYYNHQMIERQDRVVRCYSGSVSSGAGTGFADMDGYDVTVALGVNGTDPQYTFPVVDSNDYRTVPSPDYVTPAYMFNTQGPATCKDPDTEQIYLFKDNAKANRFTPSSSGVGGAWSGYTLGNFPPSGYTGYLAPAAYDTRRGRILILSIAYSFSANDIRLFTFTPSTGVWDEVTSTATGAAKATLLAATSSAGMVYIPYTDAYYVRLHAAGGQVIKIDASTWVITEVSTSGGGAIAATYEVGGDNYATYENVYNKWLYVPSLRGILYYPQYTSDLSFIRLY